MTYSVVELPLYHDVFYRYAINLEGQQRSFRIYWNEREGFWHFDVKNADGTPVLLGQKLVPQHPIAADYRLDGKALTGYFILLPNNLSTKIDTTDSAVVPQFFEFFYIYEIVE